jgi:hypothetical protein
MSPTIKPLDDDVDHVRGPTTARLVLEYGDCECPYSRQDEHLQRYADVDGVLHVGGYDAATLLQAVAE